LNFVSCAPQAPRQALSFFCIYGRQGSVNAPNGGGYVVNVVDEADEFSRSCHELRSYVTLVMSGKFFILNCRAD
jgi:hypothetical protein